MSKGYGKAQRAIIQALQADNLDIENNSCWLTTLFLKQETGLSQPSIHRAAKKLVDEGVLLTRIDKTELMGVYYNERSYMLAANQDLEDERLMRKEERRAAMQARADELGIDIIAYEVRIMASKFYPELKHEI